MAQAGLDAAVALAAANNGRLIVARDGEVAATQGDIDAPHLSASSAKTGISALAAMTLLDRGLLSSLDRTVNQDNAECTDASITYLDLLTMSAGYSENGGQIGTGPPALSYSPRNTNWAYSNASIELLGGALTILAGEPLGDFLNREIYHRIGANPSYDYAHPWGATIGGINRCYSSINLTWSVSDACRLAWLLCNDGNWNGTQLLKPETIATFTAVQRPRLTLQYPTSYRYNGREPPEYMGCLFWNNPGGTKDIVQDYAGGFGKIAPDAFYWGLSKAKKLAWAYHGDDLRPSPSAQHYYEDQGMLNHIFDSAL